MKVSDVGRKGERTSIIPWRPSFKHIAIAILLSAVLIASAASGVVRIQSSPLVHGVTSALATVAVENQSSRSQVVNEDDDDDDDDGDKSSKIISGRLVRPLGWIAALAMVSASLYYSAKRSVLVAVQVAEGPKRRLVGTELRNALDRHIVASLAAIGIALLHTLNFFGSIRLTMGWLTLLLMLVVAGSGAFGRYLTGAPGVRKNWRRFHLPLTYGFYAVLAIHVTQVIELFDD